MTGSDGFLNRWSRRKQDAKAEEQTAPETAHKDVAPEGASIGGRSGPEANVAKKEEPEFDLSTLPSIDSIVAGTDIRAFLSAGVPSYLTKAALRRAWAADPAIRDYIGLSENSWDFNAPDSMPGFGPLQPNDDVRRMVSEVFKGIAPKEETSPPEMQTASASPQETPGHDEQSQTPLNTATQSELGDGESISAQETTPANASPTFTVDDVAAHHNEQVDDNEDSPGRRRHGSALPT